MSLFTWRAKRETQQGALRGFRVRLELELDYGDTRVPAADARRDALRALQEAVGALRPEDLQALGEPVQSFRGPQDATKDLDLRLIKSAHRLVEEVGKRSIDGRTVLASQLVGQPGLSAPTVGRLLREGEPVHEYLSRFIVMAPAGRTRSLDLTQEGQILWSRIRAGAVPV